MLLCSSFRCSIASPTAHLCSELIFHTFELLECPARKLDHHIVAVRNVFVQCSVFAARNIFQRSALLLQALRIQARSGNPVALDAQCGRTGCSQVDLDDDITVCLRIMCPLYVCSADHLMDRFHNLVGISPEDVSVRPQRSSASVRNRTNLRYVHRADRCSR